MKDIAAFFARFRWALWVVLAVGAAVLLWALSRLFDPRNPEEPVFRLPEVPQALKERVQKAEEDALVARVRASATAESQRAEVQTIMQIEDGAERRRRLAAHLATLR